MTFWNFTINKISNFKILFMSRLKCVVGEKTTFNKKVFLLDFDIEHHFPAKSISNLDDLDFHAVVLHLFNLHMLKNNSFNQKKNKKRQFYLQNELNYC